MIEPMPGSIGRPRLSSSIPRRGHLGDRDLAPDRHAVDREPFPAAVVRLHEAPTVHPATTRDAVPVPP